jgi:hypothetical protein
LSLVVVVVEEHREEVGGRIPGELAVVVVAV